MAKRYLDAGQIMNDVLSMETAQTSADPVGDGTDKANAQLLTFLNVAIEELAEAHTWEEFKRTHSFVTNSGTSPTGTYDLPSDFHYMIDQTHWDQTNNLPVTGPLTSQSWTYLQGRDLSASTIYASFRVHEGVLALYPTPPSDGLTIAYEYASTNWVQHADDSYGQRVVASDDVVLFNPSLIRGYLRAKLKETKGYGSMSAARATALFLERSKANDAGGTAVSLTRRATFPYLDPYRNVGDTGFGL